MAGLDVLVAGGTGLVGGHLLERLIADPGIARIVAPTRRPTGKAAPKLTEIPADFAKLALPDGFAPKAAFCALGTTIRKAGSQAAFRAVDQEAVLSFATAARAAGVEVFALVSAIGADARSANFYLRVKGETERDLAGLGFAALHVMRPSFLLGDRRETRPGEAIGIVASRALSPLLCGPLRPYRPITADTVAAAMLAAARSGERGVRVHDFAAMVRMAGG